MADVTTLARESEVLEKDFENWSNKDNFDFHANIPIDLLKEYAVMGGLDTCCDVELLLPYINKASSILEIGAGYGRVLEYLLKIGYTGKITAIERSPQYCEVLRKSFSHRVDIKEMDVMNFESDEKFDLILCLWSGFAEFNREEQKTLVEKISKKLTMNGILCIDSITNKHPVKNTTISMRKHKYIKTLWGEIHGYFPSILEITRYRASLNIYMSRIFYLNNHFLRNFYLLSMRKTHTSS
jgi:SAM-dependent methyltransferase